MYLAWGGFITFVLIVLALDLGVFHRKSHVVSAQEAAIWSSLWISCALAFNIGLYYTMGAESALSFFTGYIIEKALSLDNLFVIILIFSSFSIPEKFQHRVLFWGIVSALVMRGVMIFMGAELIKNYHWIIYIFGGFLLYSAMQTFRHQIDEQDVATNPLLKSLRKYLPMTKKLHGQKFYIYEKGKLLATPLFLALVFIEFSDVLFAVDSVPAILAITTDPFIVFTSNIFAILGLRSLYFLLNQWVKTLHYIRHGLSVILGFVGIKMLISDFYHIPILLSLSFILVVLIVVFVASHLKPKSPSTD